MTKNPGKSRKIEWNTWNHSEYYICLPFRIWLRRYSHFISIINHLLIIFLCYCYLYCIFFQNIQKTRAVDAITWYDLKLSMILLLQLFIVPVILLWIYYFLKLSLLLFECIVETNNIQLGKIIIIELFEGIIIFVEGYYYNKNNQNIN